MPVFRYEALDTQGRPIKGRVSADTQEHAIARIRGMNYYLLNIEEAQGGESLLERWLQRLKRVKLKDVVIFSRQFATMVGAGVGLVRCMEALESQTRDVQLKEIVRSIRQSVISGEPLSEAFGRYPKVFPSLYVSMLKVAEAGGSLDEILNRVADYLENEQELRSRVKSAMTYPIVVLLFALVVILVLVFFILPRFRTLFEEMGIPLPLTTRVLLHSSEYAVRFWYLFPLALVGGVMGYRWYNRTPQGRRNLDSIKLRLPLIGDIALKIAVARFSRTLATLIRSGVPLLQALEIVAETAGNKVIEESVLSARRSVREGERITEPLAATGVFPPMVLQMIAVGEETGMLDQMLLKISAFYEAEVDRTLKALASLIEPLLIVFLGLLVGFVAISVITPIYQLVGEAERF